MTSGVRRDAATHTDVTATLLDLVRATSVSPDNRAAAEALFRILSARGFSVRTDDWGNVIGRMDFGPGPVVLYDAHIDTVEIGNESSWHHDPRGEQVGDRVVGRGTVDTKGPLAAAIHAAELLAGEPAVSGSLVLSGSVDEELAEGPSLGRILDNVAPDVVVIGEPSACLLRVGQRGRAEIIIEVTGTSSHSAFPAAGVNAAQVMTDVISSLRSMSFRSDPSLGSGELTLVSVHSEPYPSQSTTPARCLAVFDRRSVVGENSSHIIYEITSIAEPVARRWGANVAVRLAHASWRTWRGYDVDVPVFAPAWLQPVDEWPVNTILDDFENRGIPADSSTWPFCTHGSESAGHRAIPTVGFGPGDPALAHTANESITLAELRDGVAGYHSIFTALLRRDAVDQVSPRAADAAEK